MDIQPILAAATGGHGAVNPWAAIAYLVSGVLFILALRGLSSPASSRRGNRYGMAGMTIAVVTTLLTHAPVTVDGGVDTIGLVEILAAFQVADVDRVELRAHLVGGVVHQPVVGAVVGAGQPEERLVGGEEVER